MAKNEPIDAASELFASRVNILLAAELGYRACEKGESLDALLAEIRAHFDSTNRSTAYCLNERG